MVRSPGRRWSVLCVLVVAALTVLAVLLSSSPSTGPFTVRLGVSESPTGTLDATFAIQSLRGSLQVHAAVVPATSSTSANQIVYVFSDSAFPLRYCNVGDVPSFATRVASYLADLGSHVRVETVTAASLPSDLNSSPNAVLVDICYDSIPDSLISPTSTLLKGWIQAGGTLVWAGGPLAYYEAHVGPSGALVYHSLGWAGQTDLLGFPLEDRISYPSIKSEGPLLANTPSALGAALGIDYDGTADGANLTQVEEHGGIVLGYVGPPSSTSSPAAPRTSLAYIPLGRGGVYYFGGVLWGTGVGQVPEGLVKLAADIALLAGLQFVPQNGPSDYQDITLGALGRDSIVLSIPASSEPHIALVTSQVAQVYLFIWKATIPADS